MNKTMTKAEQILFERIHDSLFGIAVGDALGVPREFSGFEEMKANPVTDMEAGGVHGMPVGTWSDDTSLTLALMDSIAEKDGIDENDIAEKMIGWLHRNEYTATGKTFDYGRTTMESINKMAKGVHPFEAGGTDYMDNGNGALMRIAPLAYYCEIKDLSQHDADMYTDLVSGMTHGHEISRAVCRKYIGVMRLLLKGADFKDATEGIKRTDELQDNFFVETTWNAALWSIDNANSYREAVLNAVNLGGDTDTVAAITGSMAGILWEIPNEWIKVLKGKEVIYRVINKFDSCREKTKRMT